MGRRERSRASGLLVVVLLAASASAQTRDIVPTRASADPGSAEVFVQLGHRAAVNAIALSPDGRLLASGSGENNVKLWDAASGREFRTLTGHSGEVRAVAFTPDARTVASASDDTTVKLWEVATGRELRTLHGSSAARVIAVAPDGKTLASVGSASTVTLWDIAAGREVRTLPGSAIAFSPDGRTVAAGGADGSLKLWDTAMQREVRAFAGHARPVTEIVFATDGRLLVSADDTVVKLWDVATGAELLALTGYQSPLVSVALSPDGRTLALAKASSAFWLYDVATGRQLRELSGHTSAVSSLVFAPDGRTVLSGSGDASVRAWNVATGREVRSFTGRSGWIRSVAFAPDGRTLLSASGGSVVVWDVVAGRELRNLPGHTVWVGAVAFAPDGRSFVSSGDKRLLVWDAATGRQLRAFGDTGIVMSIAFAPDGRTLASAGYDPTINVWDVATGRVRLSLPSEADILTGTASVAFAPDGRILATSGGNDVRLWAVATGQAVRRLTGHSKSVGAIAFAPDGRLLASAGSDHTVKLWDVATGREVRTLTGHTAGVRSVAFAPDGRTLASGGGTVLTYTVRLVDGRNELRAVAFNRDNSAQSHPATAEIAATLARTRPSLHAVLAGIQHFKNPRCNLKYPVADARRLADVLRQYAAPLFQRVNVTLLTTPAETTRDSLVHALRAVRQAVNPEDLFVFFVASHGTVDDDEYFLLTSNVGSASTERLKADALSQADLKQLIGNVPTTKKLVIIDTCHAAALGDTLQTALLTRGLSEVTAMKILSRAVGSTVLSASTSTQQALEGYRGHGLFTYVIAEGLRGKADRDGDGFVSTLELATYVDEQVPVLAEQVFKRAQYPMVAPTGQGLPLVTVK